MIGRFVEVCSSRGRNTNVKSKVIVLVVEEKKYNEQSQNFCCLARYCISLLKMKGF